MTTPLSDERIAEIRSLAEAYKNRPILEIVDEVTRLRARNAELVAEPRWISVGERLPEENVDVLVLRLMLTTHIGRGQQWLPVVYTAYLFDRDWIPSANVSMWSVRHVTHWQPLPSLPEAEEATDAE